MTPSLHLKAQQHLVMTPQLQAAIRLLQMNNQELAAYIEAQMETNPLLEKVDGENRDISVEELQDREQGDGSTEDEFDRAADLAAGVDAGGGSGDFDAGMARIGAGGGASFDDPDHGLETRLTQGKSLRDHLNDQLAQSVADPVDRRLGGLLIDLLDEAGYLRTDMDDLAARLGVAPARLASVLDRVRGFDPAGLFARDLKDCLRLQLLDLGRLDPPFNILLDHLDLVAGHDLKKLATLCGVNDTYLADMLAELKRLNPKPASGFDPLVVQTAVPDVLMRTLPKSKGGGWRVELNNETLPRVLINQTYYTDVLSHAKTDHDKQYLQTQMQDAHWLTRAMDQRAQTILKVAAEIIERQNAFFLYGIEYLVPMTLKDIAEAIDMHESTVSRVTTGKFMGTPRGIFELKFFFTTALGGTATDPGHSVEAVKVKLKAMIEAEDRSSILSDETLAQMLQKDGIDIARRTVAKYREGMGIPTSTVRKKMKNS